MKRLQPLTFLGLGVFLLASGCAHQPDLAESQLKDGVFDESQYDLVYGTKLQQPAGAPFFGTRYGGRKYYGYYGTQFRNGRPYIGSTYLGSNYYP